MKNTGSTRMPHVPAKTPSQTLPVYRADSFIVYDGANLGDPITDARELVHDDIYRLKAGAMQLHLSLTPQGDGSYSVAHDSDAGIQGHTLHLDCAVTFMSPDGVTFDALVLVEVDPDENMIEEIYLHPLAPLRSRTDYRIVGIERETAKTRLAQIACVSFTRGTRITMANGEQNPIQSLQAGDRVLTRDDGPQTIRWVGQTTLRAVGDLAPIVITKGTLNNENDLILSPNHRLFIYQRADSVGIGRSELLVKAKHLVNGETVYRMNGGFVDYFQLLFDAHQIIYAEGIAAESLLLDNSTSPALPDIPPDTIGAVRGRHAQSNHGGYEIRADAISGSNAADRLRRASRGR